MDLHFFGHTGHPKEGTKPFGNSASPINPTLLSNITPLVEPPATLASFFP
jgi:hypothetical protein